MKTPTQTGAIRNRRNPVATRRNAAPVSVRGGHFTGSLQLAAEALNDARMRTGAADKLRISLALDTQETYGNQALTSQLQAPRRGPSRGAPLDMAVRRQMEDRFGADLGSVRVHTDEAAASAAANFQAGAFTSGQDIYFAGRRYNPGAAEGRRLLAHELTHTRQQMAHTASQEIASQPPDTQDAAVSQDRSAETEAASVSTALEGPGPLPPIHTVPEPESGQRLVQRQAEGGGTKPAPTDAGPSASRYVAVLGIAFHPAANAAFHPGHRRPQVWAMALKNLLGAGYHTGLETDFLRNLDSAYPPATEPAAGHMSHFGFASPDPSNVSPDNPPTPELIPGPMTIKYDAVPAILDVLERIMHLQTNLQPDERRVLRAGQAVGPAWQNIQQMRERGEITIPRWYTGALFESEIQYRTDLLEALAQARQIPGGPAAEPGAAPDEQAVTRQIYDYISIPFQLVNALAEDSQLAKDRETAATYASLFPTAAKEAHPALAAKTGGRFLEWTRTKFAAALLDPALKTHEGRVALLKEYGYRADVIEAKPRAPSGVQPLFTGVPSVPVALPPWQSQMFSTPALEPPLFDMVTDGDNWFQMAVTPPMGPDIFSLMFYQYEWDKIRIPDDQITQKIDPAKAVGESAGGGIKNEFRRAGRYFVEDIAGTFDSTRLRLGPPGFGAENLVTANAILRFVGTGIRAGFKLLGERPYETQVVFEQPGLYIVRCRAFQPVSEDAQFYREPSVAYLPVYAHTREETSAMAARAQLQGYQAAKTRLDEINQRLGEHLSDEERQALEQEWLSLIGQGGRADDILFSQRRFLQERIQAIRDGKETGNLTQLEKELELVDERYTLMGGRRKTTERLIASFVTDKGQTINLVAEAAEVSHDAKGFEYYVSDLTTPDSGQGTGDGTTRADAIVAALTDILQGLSGYGRGDLNVFVDGTLYHQRIAASEGSLVVESIENLTTVASVAAIAAAPFTGGASLSLLLPIGAVGAIPSAYRLAHRYNMGTLRWDLNTAGDIVNIVGAAIGLARVATPLRLVKLQTFWMITGVGVDGLGVLVMGAGMVKQIEDLKDVVPESERAAQLALIIGNGLVQAGIMVGGQIAHARYGHAEASPAGELKHDPTLRDPATPEPTPQERTASRLRLPPPADEAPIVSRAKDIVREVNYRIHRPERELFPDLRREGVRPAKPVDPNVQAGQKLPKDHVVARDITLSPEAYRVYDAALYRYPGREVAIYRNRATGEYAVMVGDGTRVPAPPGEYWVGVAHYHHNPHNQGQFRMPAPADFRSALQAWARGEPHTEFLEYDVPGVGRGRTEYGVRVGQPPTIERNGTQVPNLEFFYTEYQTGGKTESKAFHNLDEFTDFWGRDNTFVDPDSDVAKDMRRQMDEALRDLERKREESPRQTPAAPPPTGHSPEGGQTMAGAKVPAGAAGAKPGKQPPGYAPLMDRFGNLTPEGLAFIRRRRPNLRDLSPERIQQLMYGNEAVDPKSKGWRLHESVVLEDYRRYWKSLGSKDSFLLADSKQNLESVIAKVREAAPGRSMTPSTLGEKIETIINGDPELHAAAQALEQSSDPEVRRQFEEFKWKPTRGEKNGFYMGAIGDKRPDIVEVFPGRNLIVVTDAVSALPNTPYGQIHQFKTLFYKRVIELITGFEVSGIDYRTPTQQTVQ